MRSNNHMEEIFSPYQNLSREDSVDLLLYMGVITRNGYNNVTELLKDQRSTKDHIYVFIATHGGDPSAGYRIARALKHHYNKVTIVIPTFCKSAGTLMAIGCDELLIDDSGELGPLDIQLKKTDELFGTSSGLDITQALNYLNRQTNEILDSNLVRLNGKYSISTKTSAEIATRLAASVLEPIYAQIDPIRVGEINRALNIAFQYGKRLNEASKILLNNEETLMQLMMDYPDHGFVIDRKEAGTLFNNVGQPSENMLHACEHTRKIYSYISSSQEPLVELFKHSQAATQCGGDESTSNHRLDD